MTFNDLLEKDAKAVITTKEFGETIIFDGGEVSGVFDRVEDTIFDAILYKATFATSEVQTINKNSSFIIKSEEHIVIDFEHDRGQTTVILNKAGV